MVANTCFNATDPHVGLALSADNATQKCYMADSGLLVSHTFQDKKYTDNNLYRAILFDKMNINEGMLMENIVAQMLCHGRSRLYFYSRSDSRNRENHMEIDFLIVEGKKQACELRRLAFFDSHTFRNFRCLFQCFHEIIEATHFTGHLISPDGKKLLAIGLANIEDIHHLKGGQHFLLSA